uniref:Solute carrier family 22 member 8 n=1 Tax=Canis lupus dingo TaxID=286419 RepID=A0A8C0R0H9_CANLU
MAFSELMDRVGSNGPFQFLNLVLLGLPILNLANHNLLQIFTATTPAHHCHPPPNASEGLWVLPKDQNGKPEMCLRFIHLPNASLPNDTQGATEPCLDGWVYDLSTTSSIVTEWDLVCSSNKLKEVAQSLFMAGTLIGGIVLGDLSDRFGRKPVLTCSYLLLAASGSSAAFSPSLSVYMVFRFLCGWSISGIVLSTAILSEPQGEGAWEDELEGGHPFLLPGLAYAIPQWRWLQLTVSIPFFAFFLLSWWIPESIRWMVVSGKFSKALKILRRVATLNGKKEEGEKLRMEVGAERDYSLEQEPSSCLCFPLQMPINPSLPLRFSTGFAYYSLAMGVEEFGVNLYFLQLIFGGVDIPAKFIAVLSINHLGRHITQSCALLLAGGSILALIFVPSGEKPGLALAVFGKGCLSSSFSCLFLYTSELYPTVIRQTGMGISNLWTRVGSMAAPLVKITADFQPFIPNVLFGTITLLGGSATLFLPETLNRPLPETIEDIETWSVPCLWSLWNSSLGK